MRPGVRREGSTRGSSEASKGYQTRHGSFRHDLKLIHQLLLWGCTTGATSKEEAFAADQGVQFLHVCFWRAGVAVLWREGFGAHRRGRRTEGRRGERRHGGCWGIEQRPQGSRGGGDPEGERGKRGVGREPGRLIEKYGPREALWNPESGVGNRGRDSDGAVRCRQPTRPNPRPPVPWGYGVLARASERCPRGPWAVGPPLTGPPP